MAKNTDQFDHIEKNIFMVESIIKKILKDCELRKKKTHKLGIELKFIINSKFLQFYRK